METAHITKSAVNMVYMVSDVHTVFLDLNSFMLMTIVKVIFDSHVAFIITEAKSLLLH